MGNDGQKTKSIMSRRKTMLTCFQKLENARQAQFKNTSPHFSTAGRGDGFYYPARGAAKPVGPYPFCLPGDCSAENLFPDIRNDALSYFHKQEIQWHDAAPGGPSSHLRDSQVCCVNFLYPFASRPDALAELLRPVFPELRRMLAVEAGHFVAFEWIGLRNYLGEPLYRLPERTRGRYFTSADAAVLFEAGHWREMVLITWKYTEACEPRSLHHSAKGTDRVAIYVPFYKNEECPLDRARLGRFENLFHDPFDQLMRLQFLAHEMEKARELGAEKVRVLHIAPGANPDVGHITLPALRTLGSTALEVWQRLVCPADRFAAVTAEALFGALSPSQFSGLEVWWEYINTRYAWLAG
jgi:hypothetical protein